MAPAEPSSDASSARNLTLPEVIFSCGICQASISEVYATPESNKGFHGGSGDDDGIVTRLWIAECSHVSCGKHLAGGAAPFHPQGEQPQAPCPQCAQAGDDSPKKLYGIRGLGDGEHDPAIPQTWFSCPPTRLDGAAPGMDAVRFQFMALARYSQKVHIRWKAAEEKHMGVAHAMRDERKQRKQLQHNLNEAKARAISDAAALEKLQVSLRKWEDRMPVINTLMAAVTPMASDLREMRIKLTELGLDVPMRSYGFGDAQDDIGSKTKASESQVNGHLQAARQVQGSSSSSRKRKRDDHEMDLDDPDQHAPHHTQRRSCRDMMPPPPQRLDRREVQSSAMTLPRTRAPQHHEIHERSPKDSVSRHPAQESFVRPSQPARTRPAQGQNWSSSSARRDVTAIHQPYQEHDYEDDRFRMEEQPKSFYRTAQYREDAGPPTTSGFDQQFGQQLSASQSVPSQRQYPTSRMSYANASLSESTLQHRQIPERPPLRPIPTNSNVLQTSKRFSYLNPGPNPVPSPFKASRPSAGSISSPFFQRDAGISHQISTQRSPPRGGDVRQARERRSQPSDMTAYPSSSNDPFARGDMAIKFNRPDLPSRMQPSRGYSSFQQPPSSATLPYGGGTTISQVQHKPQYAYSRPQETLSQGAFANPPVARSRGRITLPPSTSSNQDYELNGIRGLRGGYPRHVEGYPTHHNPGFQGSRELFPAVSRRSVRR